MGSDSVITFITVFLEYQNLEYQRHTLSPSKVGTSTMLVHLSNLLEGWKKEKFLRQRVAMKKFPRQ